METISKKISNDDLIVNVRTLDICKLNKIKEKKKLYL